MAGQQTVYNLEQSPPSQPGMIADSNVGARIRPFRNDNASPIPFGLLVCRSTNTDDRGCDLANATRQVLGVLLYEQVKQNGVDGLATITLGSVIEEGEVYVKVVEDVTPDSLVRVFIDDYSGTLAGAVAGAFGDSKVAAHTALLTNAKYVSRASAGGVAKLRLNLPAPSQLVAES